MKNPLHTAPDHGRLGTIGHTVADHTAEAGQKIREEFDDLAPKVAAAASKAAHTVAHTAAERTRPVRTEAAARGSAALSGLLGAVSPEHIDRITHREAKRKAERSARRTKLALFLTAAGAAAAWALWWKHSEPDLGPWSDDADRDGDPAEEVGGPQTPTV